MPLRFETRCAGRQLKGATFRIHLGAHRDDDGVVRVTVGTGFFAKPDCAPAEARQILYRDHVLLPVGACLPGARPTARPGSSALDILTRPDKETVSDARY